MKRSVDVTDALLLHGRFKPQPLAQMYQIDQACDAKLCTHNQSQIKHLTVNICFVLVEIRLKMHCNWDSLLLQAFNFARFVIVSQFAKLLEHKV